VLPLDQGFLLVNRENRHVPQAVIRKINELLLALNSANDNTSTIQRN
jgi:hypothetical protein